MKLLNKFRNLLLQIKLWVDYTLILSGLCLAQNTYSGEMSFSYSGSLSGEFQSGVVIDSLEGIPTNGSIASITDTEGTSRTIITSLAPRENGTVDIFLVHLVTNGFPVQGTYDIEGLDLNGLTEIPATMLFIPEADTAMISGFIDTLMEGIEDSLATDEILLTILLDLAQNAFLPLNGEIIVDSVNDSVLTGGFSGEFMILVFPPQFISIDEGFYSLGSIATPEIISAPEELTLAWAGSGVQLNWQYNDTLALDGFNIYRWQDGSSPEFYDFISQEAPGYIDQNVLSGQTYSYAITALNMLGLESEFSNTESITIPQFFLGDVNGDQLINVNDVVLLINHILEISFLNDQQVVLGDMNADGEINVIDVVMIVDIILGN